MKVICILTKESWVTKGATRSLIVNGENGKFMLIPNEIANILSNSSFTREDFGEDFEFFDYFLSEGYTCSVSTSNNFDFYSFESELALKDETLILDLDKESKIELLCTKLLEYNKKFDFTQVRVFDKSIDYTKLLDVVDQITINGFELAVNFELNPKHLMKTFPKLYYIQIFNQGYNDIITEGLKVTEYIDEKLLNETSCGNVCNRNFIFNSHFKIKSNQGNSCLNNKFSIDRFGNYKNCPSMTNSYGNLSKNSMFSAVSAFNKSKDVLFSNITKNEIEECKICEFRDVCMDCRAYRTSDNIYSKPKKCNYNPLKGVWNMSIILFFIFFSFNLFSQNQYYIIDSIDFSPIPFTKVIHKEKSSVFYTNESGIFELENPLKKGDTIKVISYGYEIKNILISNVEIDTFFLTPIDDKSTLIDEVIVRPTKWTDFILNEFEKPHFGNLSLQNGGVIASYIDNSKFTKGRLDKIDVYIKSLDSNYNLKLVLFNYDILRNCPGNMIKISDVYIDFTGFSGWYSIKLKDTIYMPKDGICIGFQSIPKNKVFILEKNQCGESSVVFSSYYEKLENGNRTSFTSLQSNNWYTPEVKDTKVDNVLNLAVRLYVNGNINLPTNEKPKFISDRKVKRKLKAKSSILVLNHSSIIDLFESVIECINNNNLIAISHLIVVSKENKTQFNEFVEKNQENWLTDLEREVALSEWNYFLKNLESAEINYLTQDYIEIVFPNKSNLFLFKELTGWKISPYFKKIVH